MTRLIAFLVALLAASASSHALSCDELKAEIDQKIKAGGIVSFTLTIADAASTEPGRVVGTCGNGKSKILYVPAAGSGGSASPPSSTVKRPAVLTECKAGFTGPDCSMRVQ
ncbi:DUF1161 domain-containing protein [Variovorax robiniae]|uniref:DUF1161 domain-containing protein n=1 Tax=Variovorax robiniae TaxID=1836199 RepID=A0ABU8X8V2_9BURK